jgi:enhancing lycopene biosynthesis protein 2
MPHLEGIPWIDIINGFVRAEESSATQRLRKAGVIEIGVDSVAKPIEEINPNDADAIISRRTVSEIGQAKNLCLFAHKHGRSDECRKHLRVLAILMPEFDDVEAVAEALGITL